MPIPRHYDHNQDLSEVTKGSGALQAERHAAEAESQTWGSRSTNTRENEHDCAMQERPKSRQELIARIKQDVRPPWLQVDQDLHDTQEPPAHTYAAHNESKLPVPARDLEKSDKMSIDSAFEHTEHGRVIERPKSALHRGDFRETSSSGGVNHSFRFPGDDRYPQIPSTSPPLHWKPLFAEPFGKAVSSRLQTSDGAGQISSRDRALSHSSLASGILGLAPTSPLALQANANDSDSDRARSRSPNRFSRRRTFSPGALQSMRPSLEPTMTTPPAIPSLSRGSTFPRQAHQPSRSVSSLHGFLIPQTPLMRSRRSSLISEASPLQGTQMVGSYEESILRGRMSSIASRPLDFLAQIGVLGKGDCKPSLKCPPHIAVPFPAVFYHYGPNRNGSEAGPSPYVGMVDLENRSQHPAKRKAGNEHEAPFDTDADVPVLSVSDPRRLKDNSRHRKRGTDTAYAHPTGGYRIPQQGQLQVIIKNPHKTAVKLFLIPYDLSDMQPGQKTFIRQRSYSAGPILDMPLNARKNLGTDRPEAAISNSDDPNDRPVLRYLVHLHICCPSRGRFYLYKSLRVVFANRVPDGKEKLRNEVQLPLPKYSTYKPDAERTSMAQEGGRLRGFSLNGQLSAAYADHDDDIMHS